MFQVTVDSTACLLLNEAPDLEKAPYILRKKRKWVSEVGRTALEERRAFVESDVASVAYTIFAEGAEGGALRRALRDYDMRPVLVPFWPGEGLLSEISASRWSSGLRIFFEPDWSAFEIRTDGAAAPTSFSPSDDCSFAPLLWCAFETLPKPRAVSGALMEVALELVETGLAAYALDPSAGSIFFGPSVGPMQRLILPSCVEWSSLPKVGGVDYLYERTALGYVRQPVDKYAPQTARRRLDVHLAYDADDLARLLRLWMHSDGPVNSWWCEGAYAETVLVADTSAASIEIEVEDAGVFSGEDYICFVGMDGRLTGRRIVSIAGNILTLDSAPGVFSAATTRLTPLLMVRFVKETLRIDWKRGWAIAEIDAELIELPTETEPGLPDGESLGGTLGPQVKHRYAYLVTDGGREPWRYTSGDRPLDLGALGVFEPRPIEHGEITQELNLEQHDCELTVGWWEGNPFFEAQVDDAAPPLTVTIYEHTDDGVSAPVAIFTGQASLSYADDICQATLRGPEAILDTKIPVQVSSPRCWAPLYGAKCGLSRASLGVPVELVQCVDGVCRFIASRADGIAAAPSPSYSLAGGYAERVRADGCVQRYALASAGAPAVSPSWASRGPWRVGYRSSGAVASTAFTAFGRLSFHGLGSVSSTIDVPGLHTYSSLGTPINVIVVKNCTGAAFLEVGVGEVYCHPHESLVTVIRYVAAADELAPVVVRARRGDLSGFSGVGIYLVKNGVVLESVAMSSPVPVEILREVDLAAGDVLDVCLSTAGSSWWDTTVMDFSVGAHDFASEWVDVYPYLPVQLSAPVPSAPDGSIPQTGWTLYPGCDKSWARCQALGNSANFRGFPHMPKTNPAMVAVSNTTGSGSKK